MTVAATSTDFVQQLRRRPRVVPVVPRIAPAAAAALASALAAGGLQVIEITLRSPTALDSLRAIAVRPPDGMLVGAGTVLTPGQAEAAAAAGARFIVSPGFSSSVARRCAELGVPYVPGVATATEVMSALSEGLAVLKFFPAEAIGGVACLRAISAPFGDVAWLPTGGIESTNAPAYLSVPGVIAVGGSWMVRPDLVDAGRFDQVEALAREAAAIAPPAETGLSAR